MRDGLRAEEARLGSVALAEERNPGVDAGVEKKSDGRTPALQFVGQNRSGKTGIGGVEHHDWS